MDAMEEVFNTILGRLRATQDQRMAEMEEWVKTCEIYEFVLLNIELSRPEDNPIRAAVKRLAHIALTDIFLRVRIGENKFSDFAE